MPCRPRHIRILVTGGTGFVGRHLVSALIASIPGSEVVVLSRGHCIAPTGVRFHKCDLRDFDAIDAVVSTYRPDVVVHLAAQTSVAQSINNGFNTWTINFVSTLALARAIANHAATASFLFASTSEVYGLSFKDGVAYEHTLPRPNNVYARTKLAAEEMLNDVLPSTVQLVVARPSNHSGPGQDERFVIPSFASQVAKIEQGNIEPIVRVGDLTPMRDFLHVADVVAAYISIIKSAQKLPAVSTFNISSGQGRAISDVLNILHKLSIRPFEVEVDLSRLRLTDVPSAITDSAALTNATGWRPKHTFEGMVDDVFAFQRERQMAG
nr:GDP-mannose 4,6-dehydratase [Methylobacterium sp. Leaf466]